MPMPGPVGLWNYLREYPGRYADQFSQGMQQFARTRNPVAALGALNPTTPFIQDAALQAGGLIAPHTNRLSQAISQSSENLGLGPLAIPEVTDQQLAPLLMLGMGSPSKMGFYSPSGKALTTAPSKGTSQQYLAHLKKEPGATKEGKQTGLIQKLEEAPGTLTKEEVVSMWNPIELTETVKGGADKFEVNLDSPYAIPEVLNIANMATDTPGDLEMTLVNNPDAYYALEANFPELLEDENWGEIVVNSVFGGDSKPSDLVKYGNEQKLNLPGGEEPKEILVQLPESGGVDFDSAQQDYKQYLSQLQEKYDLNPMQNPLNTRYRPDNISEDELKKLDRLSQRIDDAENREYKSTHWSEPNVLAHIRTNKRDVGGVRALHAEEFQSDWHQTGQKKGYVTETGEEVGLLGEADYDRFYAGKGDMSDAEWEALSQRVKEWDERMYVAGTGVPDAPYKKDWHELAFKRFLMEGINDPSVDRITWTSGDVQADRYNLAKYINEIEAKKHESGLFSIAVKYKEGNVEHLTNVPSDQLDDFVGKEMAEKIINDKGGTYSGLDLEIGGEFHKNLYDKKIPQFAKKFLKKYGVEPQRVDSENKKSLELILNSVQEEIKEAAKNWPNISNNESLHLRYLQQKEQKLKERIESGNNLWYIDITPEMRQDLQQKGVPLAMNPFMRSEKLSPFMA